MYTLRQVNKNGSFNQSLGRCYNSVNRFEHPERFGEYYKEVYKKDHVADLDLKSDDYTKSAIGFIISEDDVVIPVHDKHVWFIMHNGNTVERLNSSMKRQMRVTN